MPYDMFSEFHKLHFKPKSEQLNGVAVVMSCWAFWQDVALSLFVVALPVVVIVD